VDNRISTLTYLRAELFTQAQIYNDYVLKADLSNTHYDAQSIDGKLNNYYTKTTLNSTINYNTELSKLITPNFTGRSTLNFGLDGNFKIMKPSNGI